MRWARQMRNAYKTYLENLKRRDDFIDLRDGRRRSIVTEEITYQNMIQYIMMLHPPGNDEKNYKYV
jgi:hypothetical protein